MKERSGVGEREAASDAFAVDKYSKRASYWDRDRKKAQSEEQSGKSAKRDADLE